MKNKKISVIALLLIGSVTCAQIKLSGVVKDSIGPLEMANIIAIDTVTKQIASYGFTNDKGSYELDLKKRTVYNIKISYIGLKPIDDLVETVDQDVIKNYTMVNDNVLDEISIVSKLPVIVKGDTIIYNADSFKNGSERKLEDVLKKLPGVEVNDAGEIEVEGKVVEKVMVDGKDFFSGDTKLATKNIPSSAVDKIQVLRNYGDVNQLRSVQDNQDRVAINIKLSEGKKNFWFGDITSGAGNTADYDLYLLQPKLFYYSPKYTINLIGDLNNIGEVVLDRNDLRNFSGGFRSQSPSNGTNLSLGNAGLGFLNANARNANRIETKLSALNFSYSPNEKLDLSGFLIWSGNSNGQKNNVLQNFNDNPSRNDFIQSTTDQFSNTGLFRLNTTYKKNFNNQVDYNLSGRFSNERRADAVNSLVLSDLSELEKSTPFKINQNLNYFYTLNDKNIFALEVQHLLQDEDPFYVALLENDPTNNDSPEADGFDGTASVLGLNTEGTFYELNQNRRVKSNQVDIKLDYYYILNPKSNLNLVGGTILSRQIFDSRFFQVIDSQGTTLDPTINFGEDIQASNDTEYAFTDLYLGLRYRLKSGIFTFSPGFTAHSYKTNNTQYVTDFFEDVFQKLLPEFKVIMQFKRSESLTLDYRQQVNFTDVNQLAKGLVSNGYDAFFAGDASILNESNHNISAFYRSFNLYNASDVFARVAYTKTIDQISTDFNFIPNSVVSIRTNLNAPFDNETFSAFGRVGKTFKKIRTSLGGNFNYSKSFQFLRGAVNENKIYNHSYTTSLGTNFTKAPNVSLRYRVSFADQISSNRDAFNTTTHAPSFDFDAYIWDSLTLKSDFSFNEVKQNRKVTNSFKIWDMTLAYRRNSDAKWEYELIGSNLLGTDTRTSVTVNNISRSISETFILPRFVSLRVRYQL